MDRKVVWVGIVLVIVNLVPSVAALGGKPACNDGVDNDGDGLMDMNDPGCDSNGDKDETNAAPPAACGDGADNDGDGLTDYPSDPGCSSSSDGDEYNASAPACSDGVDNDGDGSTDYPSDSGCSSSSDGDEYNASEPDCSDGVDTGSCFPLLGPLLCSIEWGNFRYRDMAPCQPY